MRTLRAGIILAGTVAFLLGLRAFGRSYSMTRWPVIPARVVQSNLVEDPLGGVRAEIAYQYILAGRVRQGRVPAPASTRAAAESLVAAYPVDREFAVGFDPGDPTQTVVRPELRWWTLALTLAGAGLMAAGFWPRKMEP